MPRVGNVIFVLCVWSWKRRWIKAWCWPRFSWQMGGIDLLLKVLPVTIWVPVIQTYFRRFCQSATDLFFPFLTIYSNKLWLSRAKLSSCEFVFLCGCPPVNLSSCEVVFLWGRLLVRSSSCEVVFLWGLLPLWSSSLEVVFLLGCLPVRVLLDL